MCVLFFHRINAIVILIFWHVSATHQKQFLLPGMFPVSYVVSLPRSCKTVLQGPLIGSDPTERPPLYTETSLPSPSKRFFARFSSRKCGCCMLLFYTQIPKTETSRISTGSFRPKRASLVRYRLSC